MAIITVSTGGGNWNSTSTWVGGAVPTSGDTVDFTATSGNLTVNVASVCAGINFTNYPLGKTITFNALLQVSGPINLGTVNTYSQAGASGIQANTTATHTSGGVIWSRLWAFAGVSQTHTLADSFNFTGSLNLNGVTSITINGNTINTANLLSTTSATTSGSTNIVFNGTGTWSNSSTGYIQNNITVSTSGILTIGTNVYYRTGTLTYTGGTVDTTTNNSVFRVTSSTTLNTNGISWNAITTTGTTIITLTSNLNTTTLNVNNVSLSFILGGNTLSVNGTLLLATGNGTVTFNVPHNLQVTNLTLGTGGSNISTILNGLFTISVSGNLTENHSSGIAFGTTSILLNGTGTWSNSNTGPLRNNLTINTLGIITISGSVKYNTGRLEYIQGTVNTGSSTLNISSATTLNTTSIAGNISWNNIVVTGGIQTLITNLTCQNLSYGGGTSSFNQNTLFINGNLTITSATYVSGTSLINMQGTGVWSNTGGSQVNYVRHNLTLSGTITVSGLVSFSGGKTLTTTGLITTTGSTLWLGGNGPATINSTASWNNVTILGGTQTINSVLLVAGTLSLPNSTSNTSFDGTAGFNANNFSCAAPGRTITLKSGLTYNVTNNLNIVGTSVSKITLRSLTTPRAIFTLSYGATQNVQFTNATNIDSSLGQNILTSSGTLTNTLNWGIGSGNFFLMF
jgi:hypothetical protein